MINEDNLHWPASPRFLFGIRPSVEKVYGMANPVVSGLNCEAYEFSVAVYNRSLSGPFTIENLFQRPASNILKINVASQSV